MAVSKEIKEEVVGFLKANNTAVIATALQGQPIASTIHYTSDDDFNIYFFSHRNTDKYVSISSGDQAALVIGTGPKHISIQAKGVVNIIAGEERERASQAFTLLREAGFVTHWPIDEMAKFKDENPVAFKFEPLELTFMNLDDDTYPVSKGHEYHQVLP